MRKNFLKKAGLLSFCAALIMNVGTTFAAPTDVAVVQKALEEEKAAAFPVGVYNARNVDHFTGDSYVAPLSSIGPMAAAVTFYDGARTIGTSTMGPARSFWERQGRAITRSGVKSRRNCSLERVSPSPKASSIGMVPHLITPFSMWL